MTLETPEGEGPFPVVVYVHGGGWTTNVTKDLVDYFFGNTKSELLANGYAFVGITYTLSQETSAGATPEPGSLISGYPQMIHDLKSGIRALRANAKEYNLNDRFIAVMGDSAGGHLSSLIGTTNGNADYENLEMGFAEYSSEVQAVISYYGPMYFDYQDHTYQYLSDEEYHSASGLSWLELGKYMDSLLAYALLGHPDSYEQELAIKASPLHQLTADAPPMFFMYGGLDELINVEHNILMIDKYKELVGEKTLATKFFEDGIHGDFADNGRTYDNIESASEVVDFLNLHSTPKKKSGSTNYWMLLVVALSLAAFKSKKFANRQN
ncbi:lipase (plasmid) [Alteromonas sp. I4]|nr:lipase [Alteromonas sp. I4]